MENNERLKAQLAIAQRLQDLLLAEYEKRLTEGTITDTGMANLQRLLQTNGWSLDETTLPQHLKDKLTKRVDPTTITEDDPDVIDFYKAVGAR